jgi:hypothetical protein
MNSDTELDDDTSSEGESYSTAPDSNWTDMQTSVAEIAATLNTTPNAEATTTSTTTNPIPDFTTFGSDMSLDEAATLAIQTPMLAQIRALYRFFIRIGTLDSSTVSFSPRVYTYAQLRAINWSIHSPDARTFFKQLPHCTEPVMLDWNSPAVEWFHNADEEDMPYFVDIRDGRGCDAVPGNELDVLKASELPLTVWRPGSLGFHWVVDVEEGTLSRRYLGGLRAEEGGEAGEQMSEGREDRKGAGVEGIDWHGDATHLLSEYLKDLENLEMIPIKLWREDMISPGFVTRSESVYEDVKEKLYEYGWPDEFKRDEWVRDLPGLVAGWKAEKIRRLEVAQQKALQIQ